MRLLPLLLSTGLLLAAWSPVHGTTLMRFSLEDLAERSERVFLGRCTNAKTVLIEGEVFTRIEFRVDEMLKGDEAEELIVHLPGGRHGPRHLHIAGMPTFAPEEDVVLFLTDLDRLGNPWPVGLAQGKFSVQQSAEGARVHQQLQGVELQTLPGSAKAAPTTAYDGMPLEQFLGQVRTLVGTPTEEASDAP